MSERPIHKVEVAGDTTGLREFANGQDSGIIVPQGTTDERETNPTEGTIRYNTTLDALEFYIGASWITLSENGVEDLIGDAAADGSTKGVSSFTATEFTVTTGNVALGTVPATKLDGTTAEFNAALSDGSFATLAGAETIENKTFDSGAQTLMTIDLADVAAGTLVFQGTTNEFNNALSDGSFATVAGTEGLSNKTIDLGVNTLTGSLAEFNTALQGDSFVSLTGTETIQNKTLTNATLGQDLNAAGRAVYDVVLKDYSETKQGLASVSGALTVDISAGNTGSITLTENVTSVAFTNVPTTGVSTFTMEVIQDASSAYTMDAGASLTTYTVGGTGVTPVTSGGGGWAMSATLSGIDLVTFIFVDGARPYVNALQDFS